MSFVKVGLGWQVGPGIIFSPFRNKVKLCLKMSGTTIKSLTETSLGELVQVGSIVLAHTWKEQPTSLN